MNTVKGLCVSKGNAKGKVYIIPNTKEMEHNCPIILVLKELDRNLLINLKKNVVGVVAEQGNIGSHGSGILRHLGIPCVLRIKNATHILKNGENIEIAGDKNCILCSHSKLSHADNNSPGDLYYLVAKDNFQKSDIRIEETWFCARPNRAYQKLRFDIIHDVFENMASFLFDLPPAKARQNKYGAFEEFGNPNLIDVCSYVLSNPQWLVEKADERSAEINEIKRELQDLQNFTKEWDQAYAVKVFETGVELYQRLFKYAYMSQAISDEILDIYLDFVEYILGRRYTHDILELKSDYVNRCLDSGIDPGISQHWSSEKIEPHIWDGEILNCTFDINSEIIEHIHEKNEPEKVKLMRDYNSFRIIVPLVYQLSEEFFYISSSINSYINWSIHSLYENLDVFNKKYIRLEDVYKLPLSTFVKMIH